VRQVRDLRSLGPGVRFLSISDAVAVLAQVFLFLHALSPRIRSLLPALSSTISKYENA
jgi:hypothetical protein